MYKIMGGATSRNVTESTIRAISTQSAVVEQEAKNSGANWITVDYSGNKGKIVWNGVTFDQNATVDTNQLLDAITTQTSQSKIQQELRSTAESYVSGLVLGSSANAENIVKSYIDATTDISSRIKQACQTELSNNLNLNFSNNQGEIEQSFYVKQNIAIFSNCVSKAVANQEALQDVQNTIVSSASATNKGLDPFSFLTVLIILIIIIVLSPLLLGSAVISLLLKIFFPFLILLGIGLIITSFFYQPQDISITKFSKTIEKNPSCKAAGATTSTQKDVETAGQFCLADETCAGFDWLPNKDTDNTIFYKTIGDFNACERDISKHTAADADADIPLVNPIVYTGSDPISVVKDDPKFQEKDIYIQVTAATGQPGYYWIKGARVFPSTPDGNIYSQVDEKDTSAPIIAVQGGRCNFSLAWQAYANNRTVKTIYIVQYDFQDTTSGSSALNTKLPIYKLERSGNEFSCASPPIVGYIITSGPRAAPLTTTETEWSGLKYTTWVSTTMLAIGIVSLVAGIIGTVVVFTMSRMSQKDVPPTSMGIEDPLLKNK